MIALLSGITIAIVLLCLLMIWLISRLDCDLQLLLYEKFGSSVHRLKGKVVWITGASSGIGEALAYVLAKNGVQLVISGTNEQRLEEVKRQCISLGQLDSEDVLILNFNINKFSEHQNQLIRVLTHFKRLDILVSNAGRSQRGEFQDIDIEVDKAVFDINVFGCVNLTRIVLKYFIDHNINGQFVVTSSIAGKIGAPNSAAYTASKHALHGYFECLRTEVHCRGISVVVVCPGPVYSRILENLYSERIDRIKNLEANNEHHSRMQTSRCAQLMAISMANNLAEVWICKQPLLLLYYLSQYCPTITRTVLPRFATKDRLNRIREGIKKV